MTLLELAPAHEHTALHLKQEAAAALHLKQDAARRKRYAFQRAVQKTAPAPTFVDGEEVEMAKGRKRLLDCSRVPIGKFACFTQAPNRKAGTGGVATCGRALVCPVCGPKIRAQRQRELVEMLTAANAQGIGLHFLTFTLRHFNGMPLMQSLRVVRKLWRKVARGRRWQDYQKRYGLKMVSTIEITTGANGWHPHLHMVLFQGVPANLYESGQWVADNSGPLPRWTEAEEAEFRAWLTAEWLKVINKAGLPAALAEYALRWVEAYSQTDTEGLANYMTKDQGVAEAQELHARGLSMEVLRGDLKSRARTEHATMSPFMLLPAALAGDQEARRLWWEYEEAVRGLHWLRTSPGLRQALGLTEHTATDEEIAAETDAKKVPVIVVLAASWLQLHDGGHIAALLWLLETEGVEATLKELKRLGAEAYSMAEFYELDAVPRPPPD